MGGVNAGAVYTYRNTSSGWVNEDRIIPSDSAADDVFGVSVSLAGGTLIVGASGEDPGDILNAGSAYSFDLPLFADGFESGDTTAWSASLP